jgi:hypothetical protein
MYPDYFEFDFERPDPGLFEMKIRRCFFRDFFDRHDARLVTTVMCAFDVTFMKAIDPSVSGRRSALPCSRSETTSAASPCSKRPTRSPGTPTSSTSGSSTNSDPADVAAAAACASVQRHDGVMRDAEGGSRTHTALRPRDFESRASTVPPLRPAE